MSPSEVAVSSPCTTPDSALLAKSSEELSCSNAAGLPSSGSAEVGWGAASQHAHEAERIGDYTAALQWHTCQLACLTETMQPHTEPGEHVLHHHCLADALPQPLTGQLTDQPVVPGAAAKATGQMTNMLAYSVLLKRCSCYQQLGQLKAAADDCSQALALAGSVAQRITARFVRAGLMEDLEARPDAEHDLRIVLESSACQGHLRSQVWLAMHQPRSTVVPE